MKSYRDFLDERKVPRGPWCVNETGKAINKEQDDEIQSISGSGRVVSLEARKAKRTDNSR